MKLRSALLASAMMALPIAAATAQPVTGLYMGGGAGANYLQDEKFSATAHSGAVVAGHADTVVGPVVVLNLGYGLGNGLRMEIEGSYRENGLDRPNGFVTFGGREQKAGGMFNVLYDFVGIMPMVQPYIGAGVGYQWEGLQNVHGSNPNGSTFTAKNSTKGNFAYQGILGVAFPITGIPGLAVTAEYRFMGMAGSRDYTDFTPGGTGTLASSSNYNHSVLVGFRYNFGQAATTVVATQTPVADVGAKTFLVFFDWDRADLTARSEGIVRDAATYSTHSQYTRIDVDGNTDTSGTPQYNMGLSERRARVVAAELVRDGVPQNAISMHAYGETKLLVPTGPGVREPQNRRVEIVFH